MVAEIDKFFDKISDINITDMTTSEILNIATSNGSPSLVVAIDEEAMFITGEISEKDKESLENHLKTNKYHKIDLNIHKMSLSSSIYLFKKFGKKDITILMGVLAKKNDRNRIKLMDMQSQFLLQRQSGW